MRHRSVFIVILVALLIGVTVIGQTVSTAPKAQAPHEGTTNIIPENTGIFVETSTGLTQLQPEAPKMKTTSPMKFMVTGGLGGFKTQGVLEGAKSPIQLPGPKVVIVIRVPDGKSVDDYQLSLLPMDSKKDHREFTASKMSAFGGMSFNSSSKDLAGTRFEKVGPSTYRVSLDLSPGEYGFVVGNQRPYTFGVQ